MDTDEEVRQLVENLVDLRTVLLRQRDHLLAADPRIDDIIWPCQQHEHVDAKEFDSRNACLVAEPSASELWLSRPVMEDIVRLLPHRLRRVGAEWFFLHQLVHVAQGLGYRDFRTLNRVGNRHETMRPDCDADFISLKTLALLTPPGGAGTLAPIAPRASDYVEPFAYLLDVLVPNMMEMEPNIFIPRIREIEVKRMFALLLLRYYLDQAANDDLPIPDGSFFPWWSEDRSKLYVFVGQVHTLGRGVIHVDPKDLGDVVLDLEKAHIDDAYQKMKAINWPPLTSETLPSRLHFQRSQSHKRVTHNSMSTELEGTTH